MTETDRKTAERLSKRGRYVYHQSWPHQEWELRQVEDALAPNATPEVRFVYGYKVAMFVDKDDLQLFLAAKHITDVTEEWAK